MNLTYRVIISSKAQKQAKKLNKKIAHRIINWLIDNIDNTTNPRQHGKALTGHLKGFWRYRVGDYRIICDIKDDELIILAITIAHRREVYK